MIRRTGFCIDCSASISDEEDSGRCDWCKGDLLAEMRAAVAFAERWIKAVAYESAPYCPACGLQLARPGRCPRCGR